MLRTDNVNQIHQCYQVIFQILLLLPILFSICIATFSQTSAFNFLKAFIIESSKPTSNFIGRHLNLTAFLQHWFLLCCGGLDSAQQLHVLNLNQFNLQILIETGYFHLLKVNNCTFFIFIFSVNFLLVPIVFFLVHAAKIMSRRMLLVNWSLKKPNTECNERNKLSDPMK